MHGSAAIDAQSHSFHGRGLRISERRNLYNIARYVHSKEPSEIGDELSIGGTYSLPSDGSTEWKLSTAEVVLLAACSRRATCGSINAWDEGVKPRDSIDLLPVVKWSKRPIGLRGMSAHILGKRWNRNSTFSARAV